MKSPESVIDMALGKNPSIFVKDSWGIGCLRQAAGFPLGKENIFQYVCPMGPSIIIWDIEKKQKVLLKQLADDLITILLKSPLTGMVLVISYSGEGKLLTSSLETICSFEVPGNNVIYSSWSHDGPYFGVCTIGHRSSLMLFEVAAETGFISLKFSINAVDLYGNPLEEAGAGLSEAKRGISKGTRESVDGIKSYYGCIFSEENTLLAVYHKRKSPCEVHLYNLKGELLKRQPISPLGESSTSMLCMSECRHGKFAIGLQ